MRSRIYMISYSTNIYTKEEVNILLAQTRQLLTPSLDLANKKLIAVQKKMADLLLLEHALEEHLGQCQNNDDDSHCPIIDSLQPK